MDSVAVVLLAGGAASRFPGKLERDIEGRPMVVRALERLQEFGHPVYVAGRGCFSRELDERITAPLIVDRHPGAGPLRAFLDACAVLAEQRLVAVAADQPNVDASLLLRLNSTWRNGDEAVVPEHDGRLEPLAAMYDRCAALREGFELRRSREHGVRDLISRLRTRFVSCRSDLFHNVNRPEDLP